MNMAWPNQNMIFNSKGKNKKLSKEGPWCLKTTTTNNTTNLYSLIQITNKKAKKKMHPSFWNLLTAVSKSHHNPSRRTNRWPFFQICIWMKIIKKSTYMASQTLCLLRKEKKIRKKWWHNWKYKRPMSKNSFRKSKKRWRNNDSRRWRKTPSVKQKQHQLRRMMFFQSRTRMLSIRCIITWMRSRKHRWSRMQIYSKI